MDDSAQSTSSETASSKLRKLADLLNTPITLTLAIVGALVTVAGTYLALIEWRVRSIVSDPDYLERIAQRVRPAMVFNAEGHVLSDSGALALLEERPTVVEVPIKDVAYSVKVIVRPKTLIAEPVVESLDFSNLAVTPKRIGGVAWEVFVRSRTGFLSDSDPPPGLSSPRFRLEIAPR